MKSYFILSFKKKLPLFIIIFALLFITAVISINSTSFIRTFYYSTFSNEWLSYYRASTNSLGLIIALFSLIVFLPFFGMNYRYSLSKSDTFRQVAIKDKKIRIVEHLELLITILIIFTICYAIFVIGLFLKQSATVLPQNDSSNRYELIEFNYGYFALQYLVIIALAILQYFISYLFISRSNNFLNSLITLGLGEVFLLTIIPSLLSLFKGAGISLTIHSASISFPITISYSLFEGLIIGSEPYHIFFDSSEYAYIVCNIGAALAFVLFIGFGALGIISFILEKDPSSEWAGKPTSNKPHQEIIFHAGALALGTLIVQSIGSVNPSFSYPFFFVTYISLYYTFYGLLNRNFKLGKKRIIILCSCIGFVVLMIFIPMIRDTIISVIEGNMERANQ